MGTIIVAIPSVDDHVWKVSSEKVPHLTMLYLGDVPEEHIAQIAKFLEHISEVSLYRFGLSVDKRGTLGDDQADVLLFEKGWSTKEVSENRGFMLQNDLIKQAYDTAPQFEGWTPHLTLGYPGSPAKEDDRDYPISYVRFDKIALWTGDFDGPEFELEDRYNDMAEVAWGDLDPDNVDDILAHYGVKGMRWGVRKSEHEGGTRAKRAPVPVSADKQKANEAAARVSKKGDTSALSNQELQQLVQRMNLEQQYSRLSSQPGRLEAGNKKVKQLLDTVDTGTKLAKLAGKTPAGQKVGNFLKKNLRKAALATAVGAGKLYYKSRKG